ncbi:MAG: glycosyltransferase [Lacunisphaera sp.]|nr:glycosyltransferase [Lacunisphaera sp.]
MSLVSVLMPVYNGGPLLRDAIESILAQAAGELELILINDASGDGSRALIDEFARRDPRVRAIHHEKNHGLAATLNEALAAARGRLVARMDQDDIALPERLGLQADFMDRHPDVAVVGSWVYNLGVTPAHDRLVRLPFTPEQIRDELPRHNCLYHPSTMLRREMVLAAGGYRQDFHNAEDYELWLRLSRSHPLANIPRPLLRYRLSTGGMTISRKWEQLRYVFLAQESHRDPSATRETLDQCVAARLAAQDRHAYFDHVVEDTCRSLLRLGFTSEAMDFSTRMRGELSADAARRLEAGLRRLAANLPVR